MKIQKTLLLGASFLGCSLSLMGCSSSSKTTDYSKAESWFMNEFNSESKKNTKADFLWFNGTCVSTSTYASGAGDISNEMKEGFKMLHDKGCNFMDKDTRVFAPYYRQIATEKAYCYTDHTDLLVAIGSSEVGIDLFNSLDYYFKNYNNGRPFFIGGCSQGGAATQFMLEHYFGRFENRKYLKQMVAAYSIAYGVDKCWLESLPFLKFATKADDYGVLLSWVTEGVGATSKDYLVADNVKNNLIINPINWKTDDTYASASECSGTYENGQVVPGKYNLQYSAERGCLICDNNTDYVTTKTPSGEIIWGGKSLHGYEATQAYKSVQDNMLVRLNAFLGKK